MYGNPVEMEARLSIMKSTFDVRPMSVRTKEHIAEHRTLCSVAWMMRRMQRQTEKKQKADAVHFVVHNVNFPESPANQKNPIRTRDSALKKSRRTFSFFQIWMVPFFVKNWYNGKKQAGAD